MDIEALRDVRNNKPFVPFTLHLADGRQVRVPHPELILIPPTNARIVAVSSSAGRIRLIDLLLVVEIELEDTKGRRRNAG